MSCLSKAFEIAGNLHTAIVRRSADKFCLHYNIFIYPRHIWIKPVVCSRMVSLFHHTLPWTHRCLQSLPSAHRTGRVFIRSVQTVCCYWILNRRKSSSEWNSQTNWSRLWWSVCWFEYSKTPGKVKFAVRKWFQKQDTNFLKDGFKKTSAALAKVYWSAWWFFRKIIMQLWK